MKHANQFSLEHANYLKKRRKHAVIVWMLRFGLLVVFLTLWEIAASFEWTDPFLTSSPSRIISTLQSLYAEGTLFYHVGVTLLETLVGFFAAIIIGCLIAILLWWSELLRKTLEPYIVVLNALPKIALGPLIIIWCGTGSKAIIFMTILVCVILVIMHMLTAFISTDENKLLLMRSMNATKLQILMKLVIPSSLASFFSMLKVAVGMSWIGSIMGEYIVSKAGLGYLIVYGGQVFKLDLVISATFLLCVLAAAMYFIVAFLEKHFVKNADK